MEMVNVERREIPILPNYYVDTHGIVYHGDKIKKLSQRNGLYNYVNVHMKQNGKDIHRTYSVSKLMGIAWLGASLNDTICFRDKDQTNMELDNLYIGTKGQFMKDNYEFKKHNGLTNDKRLLRNIYRDNQEVYQLDPETNEIVNTFSSIYEASEYYDLPIHLLEVCCFNPKKTCCKFKWCFAYDYATRVK